MVQITAIETNQQVSGEGLNSALGHSLPGESLSPHRPLLNVNRTPTGIFSNRDLTVSFRRNQSVERH